MSHFVDACNRSVFEFAPDHDRFLLPFILSDAVIFDATLRENLSPDGAATDQQMYAALRAVGLITSDEEATASTSTKLENEKSKTRFHLDLDCREGESIRNIVSSNQSQELIFSSLMFISPSFLFRFILCRSKATLRIGSCSHQGKQDHRSR